MAKEGKKVVDLIYIEKQKDEAAVLKDYKFSLEYWKGALKKLQEYYFEQHFNSTSPDVLEILAMRKFLGKFVQARLEWIINEVKDASLRRKYLNVLPPFPHQGGIKRILLHFFQMAESKDKKSLVYTPKNDIEKEISILWDIYKLRKTIDSIETVKKSLSKPDPFPSIYSLQEREKCLDSLKTVFQLMFQMSIQKEHQKTLYQGLSTELMQPENVLERQSQNASFVYPHVISKFDYRNHFFYVYYSPGMKAKISGKIKSFYFNYLDFEVIKQEFLVDWMNRRLKGNERKREVYQKYCIGDKTIDQIVQEDPQKELEVLKQLPLAVFNDITAEVNEVVSAELKTEVETFSENHGEFARVNEEFEKAQSIAKSPISKIKEMLKGKKEASNEAPEPVPEPEPEPEPEPPAEPTYAVIKLKKNQIDYPYFQKEASTYKSKLSLLRVKMGSAYTEFNKDLGKFLSTITDSAVIRRRTPKHEVIFPHIIKETLGDDVTHHLLLLGAEVKAKQLSMAYSTSATAAEDTHSYTCFFMYGTDLPNESLGEIIDKRNARGIEFHMYNFASADVQKQAMKMYKIVMKK